MKFKLIIALVQDEKSDAVIAAARKSGATGVTVLDNVRGEGLEPVKTFLGLTMEGQRDMVLLIVEEHMSRQILESLCAAGKFDEEPGTGIAFTLDIEDVIGLKRQIETIQEEIGDEI